MRLLIWVVSSVFWSWVKHPKASRCDVFTWRDGKRLSVLPPIGADLTRSWSHLKSRNGSTMQWKEISATQSQRLPKSCIWQRFIVTEMLKFLFKKMDFYNFENVSCQRTFVCVWRTTILRCVPFSSFNSSLPTSRLWTNQALPIKSAYFLPAPHFLSPWPIRM